MPFIKQYPENLDDDLEIERFAEELVKKLTPEEKEKALLAYHISLLKNARKKRRQWEKAKLKKVMESKS